MISVVFMDEQLRTVLNIMILLIPHKFLIINTLLAGI